MLKDKKYSIVFDFFQIFINFVSYSSEDEDKPIDYE